MSVDVAPAALLAGSRSWLAAERGLSRETVRCYSTRPARFWLRCRTGESAVRQLDSGQVTSFMVGYCRDRNVESAKAIATSLRALLRFLHVSGHTPIGLAGAVPGVAGWRLASLPRGVDAAVVAQLLGSCDQATVVGRRDCAILIMLVRLGLRGAEAADLRLGDLDWRAGEVTVRGKGHRIDRLPMPSDVGEAIVAYLTDGRPDCETRTVFATVRKPYRRLTAAAIRGIMGQACRRAGLPRVGAHRLRHTLATDMLRAGRRCRRSGRCCGIAATCPPRSTPRWTKTRCDRWRGRGQLRRCGHDRLRRPPRTIWRCGGPGVELITQGRRLMSFVDYSECRGSDRIASDLAPGVADDDRSRSTHDGYLARRLMSVRISPPLPDPPPRQQIPPEDALPHHKCRITPYL